MDDLAEPLLIVPLNLAASLSLDNGRAWVGLTAATGRAFAAHEVRSARRRNGAEKSCVLLRKNMQA